MFGGTTTDTRKGNSGVTCALRIQRVHSFHVSTVKPLLLDVIEMYRNGKDINKRGGKGNFCIC